VAFHAPITRIPALPFRRSKVHIVGRGSVKSCAVQRQAGTIGGHPSYFPRSQYAVRIPRDIWDFRKAKSEHHGFHHGEVSEMCGMLTKEKRGKQL